MRKGLYFTFVSVGVAGAYLWSRPPVNRAPVDTPSPEEPTMTASSASAQARAEPAPTPPRPAAPRTVPAAPPSGPPREIDRYLATTWLDSVVNYHEADRGKVLDNLADSLVRQGPGAVSELAKELKGVAPDHETERAAVFHALGRVGAALTSQSGPEAKEALRTIHRIAQEELDMPAYIPPNADLDVDHVSPAERRELVHQGNLVEKDGKLLQPTTFNKVSAIQMLTTVGNADSLEQLEAMQQKESSHTLKLALDHAVQLLTTKNQ